MFVGIVIGLALGGLIFRPTFRGYNLFEALARPGHSSDAVTPLPQSARAPAYVGAPPPSGAEAVRNQWGWNSQGSLDHPAQQVRYGR